MSEKPNLTDKAFKCRHCHAKGHMKILDTASYQHEEEYETERGLMHHISPYYETWEVCRCANCHKDNIIFSVYDENTDKLEIKPSIIHPESITYKASDAIDLIFRGGIEALKVSPGGAVNQFRVILEMIWAEHMPKGTSKPKLRGNSGIIKQLVDNHVLAGDYAEMADVLANIGHKGSHYDETSVAPEDAEMARDLCAAILEHVYQVRPKGLKLVEKLEKRFPRENGWRDGKYVDRTNW